MALSLSISARSSARLLVVAPGERLPQRVDAVDDRALLCGALLEHLEVRRELLLTSAAAFDLASSIEMPAAKSRS